MLVLCFYRVIEIRFLSYSRCLRTLYNAEGSISQRQNRALKEHTASDALPEKGKSANQSAHVFALGYFLNR